MSRSQTEAASVVAEGFNGLPWGLTTAAFRERFPLANRSGDWWRTGEDRESFGGIVMHTVQYGFNDDDRLYMVSVIPHTEDRDRLTVAAINEFGMPVGDDVADRRQGRGGGPRAGAAAHPGPHGLPALTTDQKSAS
jgi:hypothetical protein